MICRVVIPLFLAAYGVALVLLLLGTFGLFGVEQDPLAGIFLLPLGLPWNLAMGWLPDPARAVAAAAAPLVNAGLLVALCRSLRGTA